jgi:lipoprotein-anchoring transpeptidase ErfK/SrfK
VRQGYCAGIFLSLVRAATSCQISQCCSRLTMIGMRHSAIAALGMMGAVLLAACATRQVAPPPAVVVLPPPPPPAPPPRLAPLDTHRFEILPTDDVVGQVQLVVTGKDDTLPDIARRFNVGYEEIVRANPGVDPWLPGEGREVVVPTRFVLPVAPREGVVINIAAMRLFYFVPPPKPAKATGKQGAKPVAVAADAPPQRHLAAVAGEHARGGVGEANIIGWM